MFIGKGSCYFFEVYLIFKAITMGGKAQGNWSCWEGTHLEFSLGSGSRIPPAVCLLRAIQKVLVYVINLGTSVCIYFGIRQFVRPGGGILSDVLTRQK